MRKAVYVGTSLLNTNRAKHFIKRFTDAGIIISYDWTQHGQVFDYTTLAQVGRDEINGVKTSDLFFMIHPARAGTHVELGIALAIGIPIVILQEEQVEQKTFYHQQSVVIHTTEDEAFQAALNILQPERT